MLQDGNEELSLCCLSAVLRGLIELFGAVWRDEDRVPLLPLRVSGGVSSDFGRELGDLYPPGGCLGRPWAGWEELASSQLQSHGYRSFALGTGG